MIYWQDIPDTADARDWYIEHCEEISVVDVIVHGPEYKEKP